MAKDSKPKTGINAITHLLSVIADFNQLIDKHRAIGDDFAVKQYEHLKKGLIKDLMVILEAEYRIDFRVREAA